MYEVQSYQNNCSGARHHVSSSRSGFPNSVKHHYEGMGWGGGPMGGDPFGGHMLRFFANHLDLTDAQQSQIKDILAKERPTIQPLTDQLRQSHHELRQIAESGNFDEAKVGSLA